jgi:hypothetical protein
MRTVFSGPVLTAVMIAVLLAGCGGETDSGVATANGAKPSASASASSAADQGRKFAACMRDNGVDVPDPDAGTGKVPLGDLKQGDKQDFLAAMKKCEQYLPTNRTQPGPLSAEDVEKQRKFAQCMREHGVDLPDPDPDGRIRIPASGKGTTVDRTDKKFEDALEACRSLNPKLKSQLGSEK